MTAYADATLFDQLTAHMGLAVPPGYTITTTNGPVTNTTVISGVDALLGRASADIDAYLSWPAPSAAGLRIDTTTLTAFQLDCLQRATCLQGAYRLEVGEDDLAEGASRVLSAGQVTLAPAAPDRIGPDVLVLLQGAGLLKRSGCAPAPTDPDPWFDGWTPPAY